VEEMEGILVASIGGTRADALSSIPALYAASRHCRGCRRGGKGAPIRDECKSFLWFTQSLQLRWRNVMFHTLLVVDTSLYIDTLFALAEPNDKSV
jgi:hypothetical protein